MEQYGCIRLWSVISILFIAVPTPSSTIALHEASCVTTGEEQTLSLGCTDGKQLQIITVYVGKTPSWRASFYSCDNPVVLSIDWQVLDVNQTEAVRGMCNSLVECEAQVSYPSTDPAPFNYERGITFINVEYQCRSGLLLNAEQELTVVHPMSDEEISFEGRQLVMQSTSYPSLTELAASTQCHLQFPDRNQVRLDVYDLSYDGGVYLAAPYCLRWSKGPRCPLRAATFQSYYFQQNTTFVFDIETHETFQGRFWITLTTYTSGGMQGYGIMNVTCTQNMSTSSQQTTTPGLTTTTYVITRQNTTTQTSSTATISSHTTTTRISQPDDDHSQKSTSVTSAKLSTTSEVDSTLTFSTTTSRTTSTPSHTSTTEDIDTTPHTVYNSYTTPTLVMSTYESNQRSTSFLTHPSYVSNYQTSSWESVTVTDWGAAYTPTESGTAGNGVVIGSLSAVIFIVVVIASVLAYFLCNKRRKLSKVKEKIIEKRKRRGRGRKSVSPRHSGNYDETKIVLQPLPSVRYDEYSEIHELPGLEREPTQTLRMFYKNAAARDEHNSIYVNQHVADNHSESRKAPPPPRPRSKTLPTGRQVTILNNLNLVGGRTQSKVPTSSTSSDIAIIENLMHE